jgi:hypothetical protein
MLLNVCFDNGKRAFRHSSLLYDDDVVIVVVVVVVVDVDTFVMWLNICI